MEISQSCQPCIEITPIQWIYSGVIQHIGQSAPLSFRRGAGGEVHWTIQQRTTTDYYTPYTFSAKERDLETGYSYFGARYYDPNVSVWLSVDPMAGKYPGASPYSYAANSPLRFIDPLGLESEEFGSGIRSFFRKPQSFVTGDGWKDPGPKKNPDPGPYKQHVYGDGRLSGIPVKTVMKKYVVHDQQNDHTSIQKEVPNNNSKPRSLGDRIFTALQYIGFGATGIQRGQLPALKEIDALGPEFTKKVSNLSKGCSRVAQGTSVASGLISVIDYGMKEDPTWGDKAKLGVGLTSSTLTYIPTTSFIGTAIGITDALGGFNSWYGQWNEAGQIYKSTNILMLPIQTSPGSPFLMY